MRHTFLILTGLLTVTVGRAQRSTELYIPIGRSPGISGKVTATGTCIGVDARELTCTIRAGDRTWTTKLTTRTRIFLDRSQLGLPNLYGTVDDLHQALLLEVKYLGRQPTNGGDCEWIKVQVPAPTRGDARGR